MQCEKQHTIAIWVLVCVGCEAVDNLKSFYSTDAVRETAYHCNMGCVMCYVTIAMFIISYVTDTVVYFMCTVTPEHRCNPLV